MSNSETLDNYEYVVSYLLIITSTWYLTSMVEYITGGEFLSTVRVPSG